MTYPEEYDVSGFDHGFPESKPAKVTKTDGTEVTKKMIESIVGSSSGSYSKGGYVIPSGGTLVSGGITTTVAGGGLTLSSKAKRIIEGPTKAPRKVLIAFLDENDNVEWCAKVRPDSINTRFGDVIEPPEMDICFKLVEADNK